MHETAIFVGRSIYRRPLDGVKAMNRPPQALPQVRYPISDRMFWRLIDAIGECNWTNFLGWEQTGAVTRTLPFGYTSHGKFVSNILQFAYGLTKLRPPS